MLISFENLIRTSFIRLVSNSKDRGLFLLVKIKITLMQFSNKNNNYLSPIIHIFRYVYNLFPSSLITQC